MKSARQASSEKLTTAERRRLREVFKDVPFAHMVGIEFEDAEHGAATVRLDVRDQLRQNNGIMHGGAIASLIDTASAFAVLTLLEPDKTTTTVDLTIHYLRPLVKGRARAHARVIRAGRRLLVVSVDVRDEAETLAATALTTYMRLT